MNTVILTSSEGHPEKGTWIGETPTGVKITGKLVFYGDIMTIAMFDKYCGIMYYHVTSANQIEVEK